MESDLCIVFFIFFKQKTAYEMRISDWSSDVCSSDLCHQGKKPVRPQVSGHRAQHVPVRRQGCAEAGMARREGETPRRRSAGSTAPNLILPARSGSSQ